MQWGLPPHSSTTILIRWADSRIPIGRVSHFHYDADHQLESLVSPGGNRIRYEYDGNGNLVSQTNSLGEQVRFSFDTTFDPYGGQFPISGFAYVTPGPNDGTFSAIVSTRNPLGTATEYAYDRAGEPY